MLHQRAAKTAADLDMTGMITSEEVVRRIRAMNHEQRRTRVFTKDENNRAFQLFSLMDTDHSGSVSFPEIHRVLTGDFSWTQEQEFDTTDTGLVFGLDEEEYAVVTSIERESPASEVVEMIPNLRVLQVNGEAIPHGVGSEALHAIQQEFLLSGKDGSVEFVFADPKFTIHEFTSFLDVYIEGKEYAVVFRIGAYNTLEQFERMANEMLREQPPPVNRILLSVDPRDHHVELRHQDNIAFVMRFLSGKNASNSCRFMIGFTAQDTDHAPLHVGVPLTLNLDLKLSLTHVNILLREVFAAFDEDESGEFEYEEFRDFYVMFLHTEESRRALKNFARDRFRNIELEKAKRAAIEKHQDKLRRKLARREQDRETVRQQNRDRLKKTILCSDGVRRIKQIERKAVMTKKAKRSSAPAEQSSSVDYSSMSEEQKREIEEHPELYGDDVLAQREEERRLEMLEHRERMKWVARRQAQVRKKKERLLEDLEVKRQKHEESEHKKRLAFLKQAESEVYYNDRFGNRIERSELHPATVGYFMEARTEREDNPEFVHPVYFRSEYTKVAVRHSSIAVAYMRYLVASGSKKKNKKGSRARSLTRLLPRRDATGKRSGTVTPAMSEIREGMSDFESDPDDDDGHFDNDNDHDGNDNDSSNQATKARQRQSQKHVQSGSASAASRSPPSSIKSEPLPAAGPHNGDDTPPRKRGASCGDADENATAAEGFSATSQSEGSGTKPSAEIAAATAVEHNNTDAAGTKKDQSSKHEEQGGRDQALQGERSSNSGASTPGSQTPAGAASPPSSVQSADAVATSVQAEDKKGAAGTSGMDVPRISNLPMSKSMPGSASSSARSRRVNSRMQSKASKRQWVPAADSEGTPQQQQAEAKLPVAEVKSATHTPKQDSFDVPVGDAKQEGSAFHFSDSNTHADADAAPAQPGNVADGKHGENETEDKQQLQPQQQQRQQQPDPTPSSTQSANSAPNSTRMSTKADAKGREDSIVHVSDGETNEGLAPAGVRATSSVATTEAATTSGRPPRPPAAQAGPGGVGMRAAQLALARQDSEDMRMSSGEEEDFRAPESAVASNAMRDKEGSEQVAGDGSAPASPRSRSSLSTTSTTASVGGRPNRVASVSGLAALDVVAASQVPDEGVLTDTSSATASVAEEPYNPIGNILSQSGGMRVQWLTCPHMPANTGIVRQFYRELGKLYDRSKAANPVAFGYRFRCHRPSEHFVHPEDKTQGVRETGPGKQTACRTKHQPRIPVEEIHPVFYGYLLKKYRSGPFKGSKRDDEAAAQQKRNPYEWKPGMICPICYGDKPGCPRCWTFPEEWEPTDYAFDPQEDLKGSAPPSDDESVDDPTGTFPKMGKDVPDQKGSKAGEGGAALGKFYRHRQHSVVTETSSKPTAGGKTADTGSSMLPDGTKPRVEVDDSMHVDESHGGTAPSLPEDSALALRMHTSTVTFDEPVVASDLNPAEAEAAAAAAADAGSISSSIQGSYATASLDHPNDNLTPRSASSATSSSSSPGDHGNVLDAQADEVMRLQAMADKLEADTEKPNLHTKLTTNMSLGIYRRLTQSFVTVYVKSMPAGEVRKFEVEAEDPVWHLYNIFNGSNARGTAPECMIVLPTQVGLFPMHCDNIPENDVVLGVRTAFETLGRYGLRHRGTTVVLLHYATFHPDYLPSAITNYLRVNTPLSTIEDLPVINHCDACPDDLPTGDPVQSGLLAIMELQHRFAHDAAVRTRMKRVEDYQHSMQLAAEHRRQRAIQKKLEEEKEMREVLKQQRKERKAAKAARKAKAFEDSKSEPDEEPPEPVVVESKAQIRRRLRQESLRQMSMRSSKSASTLSDGRTTHRSESHQLEQLQEQAEGVEAKQRKKHKKHNHKHRHKDKDSSRSSRSDHDSGTNAPGPQVPALDLARATAAGPEEEA